jgi:hypothetical protein
MSWTGSTIHSVATIQAFGDICEIRLLRLEAAIHSSGWMTADPEVAPKLVMSGSPILPD